MQRVRRYELSPQVIDGLNRFSLGDIGHIVQFGFIANTIRPIWPNVHLVGRATTVRMPGIDIALNREVIRQAEAGDVIVVDRGGDNQTACWGGFAAMLAQAKGVAGLVVDGAVTDSLEITALKWPVFSRRVSGLVGRKVGGHGEVNTLINCGGIPVSPGDLVLGDDDGVVVIPPNRASEVLARCQSYFKGIPDIRKWVAEGRPLQDYPGVREFLDHSEAT